jgi:hypothetical protein
MVVMPMRYDGFSNAGILILEHLLHGSYP